jgi:hypothetical protein
MTNVAECNSRQDRVYTTVNRELLSTWLQTWTNQPAEVSTVRSLHISTGHALGTLKLNPKSLKRTRQRRKAIAP